MDSSSSQPSPSSNHPANGSPTGSQNESVEATIRSLRLGFLMLGAALLFLSVCFSLFVQKQNNILTAESNIQTRFLNQTAPVFAKNKPRIDSLVQDLRVYASTHPDMGPILLNHNYAKVNLQPGVAPALSPTFPAN